MKEQTPESNREAELRAEREQIARELAELTPKVDELLAQQRDSEGLTARTAKKGLGVLKNAKDVAVKKLGEGKTALQGIPTHIKSAAEEINNSSRLRAPSDISMSGVEYLQPETTAVASTAGSKLKDVKEKAQALKNAAIGVMKDVPGHLKSAAEQVNDSSKLRAPSDLSLKGPEVKIERERDENQEIKDALAKESREKRTAIEKGWNNVGYRMERQKNEYLANTFDFLSKKFSPKSTSSRFLRSLRDSAFKNEQLAYNKAKTATKSAEFTKTGKAVSHASNAANVAKNIIKPLRLIGDAVGLTPGSYQRLVMLGGMLVAGGANAAKEARFENEEVKTRSRERVVQSKEKETPEDLEKRKVEDAAAEAWKIYENAQRYAGHAVGSPEGITNVSADQLREAYLRELPKDIQERLKNPGTGNKFVQALFRKHLGSEVDRLSDDISKIEKNKKLSDGKKKSEVERVLRKWEKRLLDYDRALTQYGTVDSLAMIGRYVEQGGQAVVAGMTVLSVGQLFNNIAHAVTHTNIGDVIKNTLHRSRADNTATQPEYNSAERLYRPATGEIKISPDNHFFPEGQSATPNSNIAEPSLPGTPPGIKIIPPEPNHITDRAHESVRHALNTKQGVVDHPIQATTTPPGGATIDALNKDAIIGKGEGIEHALRRQIEHDPDLAKALGFKGDTGDAKALHEFSGHAAHEQAIAKGYFGTDGNEVRIREPGKVAYQFKIESNGKVSIVEMNADGSVIETHASGDVFEKDLDKNEYQYKVDQARLKVEHDMNGAHHEGEAGAGTNGEALESEEVIHARENLAAHQPMKIGITPGNRYYSPQELLDQQTPTKHLDALHDTVPTKVASTQIIPPQEALDTSGPFSLENFSSMTPQQQGDVEMTFDGPRIHNDGTNVVADSRFGTSPMRMPHYISREIMIQTNSVYSNNIAGLGPNTWRAFHDFTVKEVLNMGEKTEANPSDEVVALGAYLKRLQEVSGLKPKGKILFMRAAETVEEFTKRSLQRIAEDAPDRLKDVTIRQ